MNKENDKVTIIIRGSPITGNIMDIRRLLGIDIDTNSIPYNKAKKKTLESYISQDAMNTSKNEIPSLSDIIAFIKSNERYHHCLTGVHVEFVGTKVALHIRKERKFEITNL